jgi:hypothetical protein
MPFQIVKVKDGFKVKKKQPGRPKFYSKKAISKETALKQMRALYSSEK